MYTEKTAQGIRHARVQVVRRVGPGAVVVRFDRVGLNFEPGQNIMVGTPDQIDMREYSGYSTPEEDFLEILVKAVDGGAVSPALATLRPGDSVTVNGPSGEFLIDGAGRRTRKFTFIATGTGIAPFHCFAHFYPGLDYELLHGVRTRAERYEHETYPADRYVACISGESPAPGEYAGRVTSYLKEHPVDPARLYYLCGNADMIYEVMALLQKQGVARDHIFGEIYF